MAAAAYIFGTLVTLLCGLLLIRGYGRVHRRLLLWSGICFCILALQNFLIFLDLIILPQVDLYFYRLLAAAAATLLLLYGLIWEGDR